MKLIDAEPLMERLKAAIAFGNEHNLPTDELEQILEDIEEMEEYKGDGYQDRILPELRQGSETDQSRRQDAAGLGQDGNR